MKRRQFTATAIAALFGTCLALPAMGASMLLFVLAGLRGVPA